jgi:hypothetical protein
MAEKRKTIWCLFGIFNEYSQPDNDLHAWWAKKPEYSDISKLFFRTNLQEDIKNILDGKTVRIGETDYRLREISEGKTEEIESE